MSGDDGHKEEKIKQCPFLKEWCIRERCAVYSELFHDMGGVRQKFGICALNALVIILSEINQKTQLPQPKIEIPKGLFKG